MLATKLLNLLKSEFNINLSVRELFSMPTVAGLAQLVDGMIADPNASISAKTTVDLSAEVEIHDLKNIV